MTSPSNSEDDRPKFQFEFIDESDIEYVPSGRKKDPPQRNLPSPKQRRHTQVEPGDQQHCPACGSSIKDGAKCHCS